MTRILLTILVAFFITVQTKYLEDARKFMDKFAVFSNESTNLEKLNLMAEYPKEIGESMVSVALLIAAGVNKSLDTDDEQAIEDLSHSIKQKFEQMEAEYMNRLHSGDSSPFSFHNHAEADIIEPIWRRYTDAVSDKLEIPDWYDNSTLIRDFERNCEGHRDYDDIVIWFKLIIGDHCPLNKITTGDLVKYVRTLEAIREAESRVKTRTSTTEYTIKDKLEDVKTRILYYVTMDGDLYERHLRMIHEIYPETLDDLLKELLFISADMRRMVARCILHKELLYSSFTRPNLFIYIQDLIKLQYFSIVCTAMRNYNDTYYVKLSLSRAIERIGATAEHLAAYFTSIENLTWPELAVEAAKRAAGFDPIPPNKFNEIASEVQRELKKYGSEFYSYQVLITETRQKHVYWSAESKTNDYAYFANLNGIDCHIFRYNTRGAEEPAEKAYHRFKEDRERLLNVLQNSAYSENTSDVMEKLLATINFVYNDAYNSAILLRNEAFLEKNVKIHTGGIFLVTNGTNSVTYPVNSFYKAARSWKLYLFI